MSYENFNPKDFYDLALYIKNYYTVPENLKEATNRTCISRVYYAVFLLLREKILALPLWDSETKKRIENTNDAHAIVADAIKNVDPKIGNFITNLRSLRNKADYKIDIEMNEEKVEYVFRIASEIFTNLDATMSKVKASDIISAWHRIQERRTSY
ncbi:MAG: HEPN domain-containing protein [Thaumarchaeota archaeon]|nr:HEPN domain-containing protein [Nitrososphaerota archaeon]